MKRYLICARLIRLFQCLVLIGVLSALFDCNKSFGQGRSSAANSELGSSVAKRRQYFETRLADLEEEWRATNWLPAVADYAGQIVPFLSWWRQKQAAGDYIGGEGFLMSSIIAENVSYVWGIPDEGAYEKAITYLKNKNTLEALRFARAVNSFSSSDRLLTNLLSIFQITFLPVLFFALIRRLARTRLRENIKLYVRKSLKMAQDNSAALGTIAVAVLVTGFFLANGYSASQGILGSILQMEISLDFLKLPYRWVVILSLLLLLYASFLFITKTRK